MTKQELLSLANTGDHPSDWAKEAANWAKQMGLAVGDGEGNFGWQQPITREALAVMLYRFSQLQTERLNTQEEESVLAMHRLFFCAVLEENFYRKQLHAALSIL